jgi:hypothetical protein
MSSTLTPNLHSRQRNPTLTGQLQYLCRPVFARRSRGYLAGKSYQVSGRAEMAEWNLQCG